MEKPETRDIITMLTDTMAAMRLFQLISPSLPTGAFTYSQGLEWAIEQGWVKDKDSLISWLESILHSSYQELEIPLLKRLYTACDEDDLDAFSHWCDFTFASRETKELRLEEQNRGRAMVKIIEQLDENIQEEWLEPVHHCQLGGYGLLALRWDIPLKDGALGYTWGWLENMVMTAVKTVPLGQSAGQQALAALIPKATEVVEAGLDIEDEMLGGSCPVLAISSSLHETQYTRLFRS